MYILALAHKQIRNAAHSEFALFVISKQKQNRMQASVLLLFT